MASTNGFKLSRPFYKILHLWPLERKSAADVATALLDIFLSMNRAKMCHHEDLSANLHLCKLGLFASQRSLKFIDIIF